MKNWQNLKCLQWKWEERWCLTKKHFKRGATCLWVRHKKNQKHLETSLPLGMEGRGQKAATVHTHHCRRAVSFKGCVVHSHTRRHASNPALSMNDTQKLPLLWHSVNQLAGAVMCTLCLFVYTSAINTFWLMQTHTHNWFYVRICAHTPKCTSSTLEQIIFFSLHGRKRKQKRTEQRKQSAQSRVTEGN